MSRTNVQQMEDWFAENGRRLSGLFPVLRFHLWHAADPVQGKGNISMDGPFVTASISLWNKGDVQVLVLDGTNGLKEPVAIDDRLLTADDEINSLLESYVQNIQSLGGWYTV